MQVHDKGFQCRDPRCRCHSSAKGFLNSYVFSDKTNLILEAPIATDDVCKYISSHLEELASLCVYENVIPGHIKASLSTADMLIASFSATLPGKVDTTIPEGITPPHQLTDLCLTLNIILVGKKNPR